MPNTTLLENTTIHDGSCKRTNPVAEDRELPCCSQPQQPGVPDIELALASAEDASASEDQVEALL